MKIVRLLIVVLLAVLLTGCLDPYQGEYAVFEVKGYSPWRASIVIRDLTRVLFDETLAYPPDTQIVTGSASPGLRYDVRIANIGSGEVCVTVYLSPATTIRQECRTDALWSFSGKLPVTGV